MAMSGTDFYASTQGAGLAGAYTILNTGGSTAISREAANISGFNPHRRWRARSTSAPGHTKNWTTATDKKIPWTVKGGASIFAYVGTGGIVFGGVATTLFLPASSGTSNYRIPVRVRRRQ